MREFYIVDVFAEEKYAGNQLAVIRGTEQEAQVGASAAYPMGRPLSTAKGHLVCNL